MNVCVEPRCVMPHGHPPLELDEDDPSRTIAHLLVAADLVDLLVPIGELIPHPNNPRQGDVGAIAASLVRFGIVAPARVQSSTGFMAAGNHTWKAGKALGAVVWPRVRLELDDRETLALLVADNRLHDLGSYEDRAMAAILADLASHGELAGIGYDGEDVDTLLRMVAADAEGYSIDRTREWDGMPEFAGDDVRSFSAVIVHFRNAADEAAFATLIGQAMPAGVKRRSLWHPAMPREDYGDRRYAEGDES